MAADLTRRRPSVVRLLALLAGVAAMMFHGAPGTAAGGVTLAEKLALLKAAYPDHIATFDETHVVMRNGAKFVIDDRRAKSHEEKLAEPDIEDMLAQTYPVGNCLPHDSELPAHFEPGRIRHEDFFKAIYGASEREIASRLTPVDWFGQTLQVSSSPAVVRALQAVKDDLAQSYARLAKYLSPSAGTYRWRPIAGTSRLSTHSFAIAIDISTSQSDYWRWSGIKPGAIANARRKIPQEIVAAFERHDFIWGGNWYHFDTMHFEYRPELVAIGKLASQRGCAR